MNSPRHQDSEAQDYTPTEMDRTLSRGSPAHATDSERGDSGSFATGDLLAGRFEIVRWIASGGMGDVYEAWDRELDERVAVKTIRQEIASDRQAMDRFRREISLARKVTHPGVCRIFDVFFHSSSEAPVTDDSTGGMTEGTIAFLTMELLDGATLSDHLREAGAMTTDDAWPLVRQMAAALAAAHEVDVVHRDFKTSNVMLVGGSQGVRAVVSDFGLARQTQLEEGDEKGVEVTVPGEVVGSPAYMAPEQATGGEITPATDVYSLGVVIFQMVTGRLPFEAASPLAALIQRVKENPPSPGTFVKNLDSRWEAVILKCLAREPTDRYPTAAQVLEALQPAVPRSLRSQRLRRRLRWVEGLLVVFLAIAAIAHLPIFRRSTETETTQALVPQSSHPSVAVLGFKNLSGKEEAAWLATAMTELLATELAAEGGLRTIPGENVARMKLELAIEATDGLAADTLKAIRRHLNTDFVVLGSYLATSLGSGGRLRLDLRIQETSTGATIATLSETSTEAGLLGLIGRLGADLRQSLRIDPPAEDLRTIEGAALPANPEAARLYAEGLAELRSFQTLAARDRLQQAVTADPGYAPAFAALAEAWSLLGYDAEAMDQIAIAFELSADFPHRERLLIEGQYREAAQEWERAIKIYQTAFEAFPNSLEHGLDLVRTQIKANLPQDAEVTLRRLRRLTPPAGDDPRIDLREADLAWSQAQYDRTLEASNRATEKGKQLGARLLTARADRSTSRALWRLGRLQEALAAAQAAEQAFFELGDRAGGAMAINLYGIVLYEQGDLDGAFAAYDRALAVFRDTGSRTGIDGILNNQAILYQVQGNLERAAELYEETLQIARETGDKTNTTIGLYNLALVRRLQGRVAEAKRMHEQALAIAREIENPYLIATRLAGIAGLLTSEGQLTEARRHHLEALDIMRDLSNRDGVAHALHSLGRLDLSAGSFTSARQRLEESLTIREDLGAEGRAHETRLTLARLALENGDIDPAISMARDVAAAFAASERPNDEATAHVILARAALVQGQLAEARRAIDRARMLTESSEEISSTITVKIFAARVEAAEGRDGAALAHLDEALASASEASLYWHQLEARLATGEIEILTGRDAAGRTRLARVEQDATERGFLLIARKARQARAGDAG